jgi:hypothetical protein
MIGDETDDPGRMASLCGEVVRRHLADEEHWLRTSRALLCELRDAVAGYNLAHIALCVQRHRAHEADGTELQSRRAALRSRLSAWLCRPAVQVTLSRVLPHLPDEERALIRTQRQALIVLARDVAQLQRETQELLLHVHHVSHAILSEVFGGQAAGARYAADGELRVPASAAALELRS